MAASSIAFFRKKIRVAGYANTILLISSLSLAGRGVYHLLLSLRWPLSLSPDATLLSMDAWMWLQGNVPYRDFFAINLPFSHIAHAFGILVFGDTDAGLRLLNLSVLLLAAFVSSLYLWRSSRLAALVAFSLTLTLTAEATTFGQLQRETLLLPVWIGALWIVEKNIQAASYRMWILWGALLGVSLLIKPTSIFFGAMLFFYFAVRTHGQAIQASWKEAAITLTRSALMVGCGIFAVFLIPVILGYPPDYLLLWKNNLDVFTYGIPLVPPSGLLSRPLTLNPENILNSWNKPYLIEGEIVVGIFTLFHVAVLVGFVVYYRKDPGKLSLLFLVAGGFVSYLIQRRGYAYHLIPVWHGLNLMLSVLITDLARRHQVGEKKASNGVFLKSSYFKYLAIFLMLLVLVRFRNSEKVYSDTGFGYLFTPTTPPTLPIVAEINASASLLRERKPERRPSIQLLELNTLALGAVLGHDIEYASGFAVADPIVSSHPHASFFRKKLMTALQRRPPDLFVIALFRDSLKDVLKDAPEILLFLNEHYYQYKRVNTEPEYLIFVRNDLAPYLPGTISTDGPFAGNQRNGELKQNDRTKH